jgi:sugar lactone lactonase YvrE
MLGHRLAFVVLAAGLLLVPKPALAVPYTLGNVFASVASGTVTEFTPTGTFVQSMTNSSGFTTGSAFDAAGHLYVTAFSTNFVSVFHHSGTFTGTFGSGYSTPESIVFDASGNVYVGNVGGGIRKFDSSGTFLGTFAPGVRIDFMDLTADQSTMYYGQEGQAVHAWDLTTNMAAPDFAALPGCQAFGMRILADGGLLVACGGDIRRTNSAGTTIQTYDDTGNNSWFALNLDPDGTSFWSGDFSTSEICRFDIAAGTNLGCFSTGTGTSTLFGLSVFGEITQGGPGPSAEVPEPGTMLLVGSGVAALIARRRRLGRRA